MTNEVSKLVNDAAIKAVIFIMRKDDEEALALFKRSVRALCKEVNVKIPQMPAKTNWEKLRTARRDDSFLSFYAEMHGSNIREVDVGYVKLLIDTWKIIDGGVQTKDIHKVLDFMDPYSHFRIFMQSVVIACIHLLHDEELRELEFELKCIDFTR